MFEQFRKSISFLAKKLKKTALTILIKPVSEIVLRAPYNMDSTTIDLSKIVDKIWTINAYLNCRF